MFGCQIQGRCWRFTRKYELVTNEELTEGFCIAMCPEWISTSERGCCKHADGDDGFCTNEYVIKRALMDLLEK